MSGPPEVDSAAALLGAAVGASTLAQGEADDRTPARLLADAAELRELAGRLRAAASAAADVLDAAVDADNPTTWEGPWLRECRELIRQWRSAARVSAEHIAERARALDVKADELEDLAAASRPSS